MAINRDEASMGRVSDEQMYQRAPSLRPESKRARYAEVVTYAFAHVPGEVSLCAVHQLSETGLGPVQHGAHDGECDRCAEEE